MVKERRTKTVWPTLEKLFRQRSYFVDPGAQARGKLARGTRRRQQGIGRRWMKREALLRHSSPMRLRRAPEGPKAFALEEPSDWASGSHSQARRDCEPPGAQDLSNVIDSRAVRLE
jgi:hypothetical protein